MLDIVSLVTYFSLSFNFLKYFLLEARIKHRRHYGSWLIDIRYLAAYFV